MAEGNMEMTAFERRLEIIKLLCKRKFETRANLAFEFGVCVRTISYDVSILSLEFPIYSVRGTYGGIYIMKDYKFGDKYFTDVQTQFLVALLPVLSEENKKMMVNIINEFILPKIKTGRKSR